MKRPCLKNSDTQAYGYAQIIETSLVSSFRDRSKLYTDEKINHSFNAEHSNCIIMR